MSISEGIQEVLRVLESYWKLIKVNRGKQFNYLAAQTVLRIRAIANDCNTPHGTIREHAYSFIGILQDAVERSLSATPHQASWYPQAQSPKEQDQLDLDALPPLMILDDGSHVPPLSLSPSVVDDIPSPRLLTPENDQSGLNGNVFRERFSENKSHSDDHSFGSQFVRSIYLGHIHEGSRGAGEEAEGQSTVEIPSRPLTVINANETYGESNTTEGPPVILDISDKSIDSLGSGQKRSSEVLAGNGRDEAHKRPRLGTNSRIVLHKGKRSAGRNRGSWTDSNAGTVHLKRRTRATRSGDAGSQARPRLHIQPADTSRMLAYLLDSIGNTESICDLRMILSTVRENKPLLAFDLTTIFSTVSMLNQMEANKETIPIYMRLGKLRLRQFFQEEKAKLNDQPGTRSFKGQVASRVYHAMTCQAHSKLQQSCKDKRIHVNETSEYRSIRNRVASASNWDLLREKFSLGILVLISTKRMASLTNSRYKKASPFANLGLPMPRIENTPKSQFETFVQELAKRRGSFLSKIAHCFDEPLECIMRGTRFTKIYNFELEEEGRLLKICPDTDDLVVMCGYSSTLE